MESAPLQSSWNTKSGVFKHKRGPFILTSIDRWALQGTRNRPEVSDIKEISDGEW